MPDNGHKHLRIKYQPLEKLIPYARNARTHSEAQVAQIAGSIREFGWTNPVLVDAQGNVVAGHGRIDAARVLGIAKVPTINLGELTATQRRALLLADNKLALNAGWDAELLSLELSELKELGQDLELIGFDEDELADIFGNKEPVPEPEPNLEPPAEPETQPGEIIELGPHRLMCGDAGNVDELDRLLDGGRIHLVNTDPPYNVKVEPRSNNAIVAGLSSFSKKNIHATQRSLRPKDRPLVNDFVSDKQFEKLLHAWFGNIARVLEAGRGFYIWGGYSNVNDYPQALSNAGLYMAQIIVWVKEHPVLTRKDFMGNHESAFYGWKEGAAHVFLGPDNVADVWSVKKINPNQMVHLTEKPVELAMRALQYSSRRGENVLDLFLGSGTTLIAADQLERVCYGMEIDPRYCDVIKRRYEAYQEVKAKPVTSK